MSDATFIAREIPASRETARRRLLLRVEVSTDLARVADRWRALAGSGKALAFQVEPWIASWYATLGRRPDYLPLAVTIVDATNGRDLMGLPLVRRTAGGMTFIEFADCGLPDYNAPIIGSGAPRDAGGARDVWRALLASLPKADVLNFAKMPREVDGVPNPLALAPGVRASRLNGNVLEVRGEWSDWHWGLERTFRKELERSLRVFEKNPGARFRRIADPDEAARILRELKRLQRERIVELGLPYVLDEPENDRFYDELVARGLPEGGAVLTALLAGDTVVAALLGVARGRHYAMVRLAAAGGSWRACSPGRLIIERTMMMLHREGFNAFDFTIGDYDYKRRLGARTVPLCEVEAALGWRGAPFVARERARAAIREYPRLRAIAARLRDAR